MRGEARTSLEAQCEMERELVIVAPRWSSGSEASGRRRTGIWVSALPFVRREIWDKTLASARFCICKVGLIPAPTTLPGYLGMSVFSWFHRFIPDLVLCSPHTWKVNNYFLN